MGFVLVLMETVMEPVSLLVIGYFYHFYFY